MKALILNAFPAKKNLQAEKILRTELKEKGWQLESFALGDMDIKPCASCGSCATNTPGLCPQKDGMEKILAQWVQSQLVIFFTPISFGGYHSDLKKAVDRLLPLKAAYFTVHRGELHHENRYKPMPALLTIGILREENTPEREAFRYLTERNAVNFLIKRYAAVVITENDAPDEVKDRIERGLKEVE